jgi:hypothetical protein
MSKINIVLTRTAKKCVMMLATTLAGVTALIGRGKKYPPRCEGDGVRLFTILLHFSAHSGILTIEFKCKVVFSMTQVSVQLENTVAEHLAATARENGYTLAGYISAVVSGHCAGVLKKELDAKRVLLDLIASSEPDPTFVRPAEIPWDVSTPREALS